MNFIWNFTINLKANVKERNTNLEKVSLNITKPASMPIRTYPLISPLVRDIKKIKVIKALMIQNIISVKNTAIKELKPDFLIALIKS